MLNYFRVITDKNWVFYLKPEHHSRKWNENKSMTHSVNSSHKQLEVSNNLITTNRNERFCAKAKANEISLVLEEQ